MLALGIIQESSPTVLIKGQEQEILLPMAAAQPGHKGLCLPTIEYSLNNLGGGGVSVVWTVLAGV